jgi:tellurite resistance protein TehA-like permease
VFRRLARAVCGPDRVLPRDLYADLWDSDRRWDTLTFVVILLSSLAYWGAGFVLYLIVITVVTYRLMAYSLAPADWHGPFWITMGTAAITTLAGATLDPRLGAIPAWEPYAPMTLSVTFLGWAIAT